MIHITRTRFWWIIPVGSLYIGNLFSIGMGIAVGVLFSAPCFKASLLKSDFQIPFRPFRDYPQKWTLHFEIRRKQGRKLLGIPIFERSMLAVPIRIKKSSNPVKF